MTVRLKIGSVNHEARRGATKVLGPTEGELFWCLPLGGDGEALAISSSLKLYKESTKFASFLCSSSSSNSGRPCTRAPPTRCAELCRLVHVCPSFNALICTQLAAEMRLGCRLELELRHHLLPGLVVGFLLLGTTETTLRLDGIDESVGN
ncbi:hypothetical protein E2562_012975 [Oryza meyeriana var. granulata]|uniref:Uncharacterized protein n=1 Tax=Oryza meyeriana var. granulata TaxID=110450 RepID=A0A6G1DI18_9ORYZ|nr:hypothetical protein E2562_012975 [Oryza meyeriana var. granulata]